MMCFRAFDSCQVSDVAVDCVWAVPEAEFEAEACVKAGFEVRICRCNRADRQDGNIGKLGHASALHS